LALAIVHARGAARWLERAEEVSNRSYHVQVARDHLTTALAVLAPANGLFSPHESPSPSGEP
jgi:hypothetical protein